MQIELYNPVIVAASVIIGIISSYTALILIERISDPDRSHKKLWSWAGAAVMGMGNFSMHFIGMLAFGMGSPPTYNLYLLLASLVVSIISAYGAFHILFVHSLKKTKIILSGIGLGTGIGLSHILAVAAGTNIDEMEYSTFYVMVSAAIALIFSTLALKVFFQVKESYISPGRKVIGGVVLGITISLMHYTGMEAIDHMPASQNQLTAGLSAGAIVTVIFILVSMIMFVSIYMAFVDLRALNEERGLLKKVQESEERYRHLVELSPDAIVVQNEKEIVFVNEACLHMIGAASKEEVMGKSVMDYVHPNFQDSVKEAIREKKVGSITKPIELQIVAHDGSIVDTEATGVKMKIDGEAVMQFMIRNVTEKKRIKKELEENRQQYQSLFDQNTDGIFSMDASGKLLHTNKVLEKVTGYSAEELAQMTFHPLVKEYDLDTAAAKFSKTLRGKSQDFEVHGIHKLGYEVPVWIKSIPIVIDGKITGVYVIAKNISKEKQFLSLLEESEEKYRSLFELSLDAVFELDVDGWIRNVNKKAEELICTSKQELVDTSISSLHIINKKELFKALSVVTEGKPIRTEWQLYNATGSLTEVDIIAMPLRRHGETGGIFIIARDITEKKQIELKMQELAFTDQVTLLPNRHWLYKHLNEMLKRARINKHTVGVLIVDFDDFKGINDLLGQQGGDQYLREMACRIKTHLLQSDGLARLGGDEFIIILENVTKEEVTRFAESILKEMNRPVVISSHEVMATMSIGISMQTDGDGSEEILITQADVALHAAKHNGKNTYQFFTQDLSEKMKRETQLQNAMLRAVEQNEFELYYQPQVDLQTEEVVGLEALIRWNSPFGLISPTEFIPLAEESGQITSIGEWVIKEACRQIKNWEEKGLPKVKIAVNISAKQFKDVRFSDKVKRIMKEADVDPLFFEIEITESVMLDIEESEQVIKELKEFGIKLAIDDFGTGYSSLNAIKNIEVNTLKVDKSLIDEVICNNRNMALLSTIINIGKDLGTEVVLEGIERQEQVDVLKSFHVIGQGYYYSCALPAEQLEMMLIKETPQR